MLDLDAIDKLNSLYDKGVWIKTAILTESVAPLVRTFWADYPEAIIYAGNQYVPLKMFWLSVKSSVGMPIDGSEIGLSNIGGQVNRYLKTMDPTGMPITIQLLHLDLLSTMTKPFERYFKVRAVRADINAAIFSLGRELGTNKLPRRLILAEEAL